MPRFVLLSLAASQPFSWIRAAGLRSIAAALSAGLEDGQALTTVLEATYSQGDPATHALHTHWASSVDALFEQEATACVIHDGLVSMHSLRMQPLHRKYTWKVQGPTSWHDPC